MMIVLLITLLALSVVYSSEKLIQLVTKRLKNSYCSLGGYLRNGITAKRKWTKTVSLYGLHLSFQLMTRSWALMGSLAVSWLSGFKSRTERVIFKDGWIGYEKTEDWKAVFRDLQILAEYAMLI